MEYEYTKPARRINYMGQALDSALELKFILSIDQTHAWLRDGLEIYYDLDHIDAGLKASIPKLVPDFLIRNWTTGEATLVEIKPSAFTDRFLLQEKIKIAKSYIAYFQYDWTYKIMKTTDIKLTSEQLNKYQAILVNTKKADNTPSYQLLQNNTRFTDPEYRRFVMDGVLPASAR